MYTSKQDLKRFIDATAGTPHDILGMHPFTKGKKRGILVRAFLSGVEKCEVVDAGSEDGPRYPMEKVDEHGFFEVLIEDRDQVFAYRLRSEQRNKEIRQFYDPYSFLPTISDSDLYLFNQGNEHRIYEKLGAHPKVVNGVPGVSFAVWAPNASRVSLVGSFNDWDGRYHPMRSLGASGVWELFVPGMEPGEMYKFELRAKNGDIFLKTDPYGCYFEAPPNNASIVYDHSEYGWSDQAWMAKRVNHQAIDQPMSVYEVHLGSWKRRWDEDQRPLTYAELAVELADYVTEHGFTHIELMPVAEHPFDGSWGYQVTGYYAPTHRFGTPDDFKAFVDYMHQRDIGVILDWVPAHFPRDIFALPGFDGTCLYEHEDPRLGAHMDWGTLIFNFGRHEVKSFLVANALSWLDRYHIDGLRVDAVASMLYLDYSREEGQWIPNQYGGNENLEAIAFLREANDLVHKYYPGTLMIAEESTSFGGVTKPPSEGGLGFDLKWNMGWMHDNMSYFEKDPIYRKHHQNNLTFGMLYQYAENFVTVFSHDEVTHGKGSMLMKMGAGSITDKSQTLRSLYGHMWAYPGKKLLFMGSEFGQSEEWNYDKSLQWHLNEFKDHNGISSLIKDLNRIYRTEAALAYTDFEPESFRWIACWDAESSIISYVRTSPDGRSKILVIGHFTPVTLENYRIGLPSAGHWREILNTDSEYYGGSNAGNVNGVNSEPIEYDNFPQSGEFTLPPLSTLYFKWEG
ncbi:1,4-alpha-glucan branching protein GlgB [Pelagicoccus mobilis]|nr:1,4-alpha-glucan branching protein GlgB [Pelagicoccus mobilis]